MSDIQVGAPSNEYQPREGKYKDLIDVAMESPGEWFSLEVAGSSTATYNSVSSAVGRRVSEVKIQDGRIYLRVRP